MKIRNASEEPFKSGEVELAPGASVDVADELGVLLVATHPFQLVNDGPSLTQ